MENDMKKDFILQGLNCADCASKIEKMVSKIEGVESASISLSTSRLQVRIKSDLLEDLQKNSDLQEDLLIKSDLPEELLLDSASLEDLLNSIERIVHSYEPEVQVFEAKAGARYTVDDGVDKSRIPWLIAGGLIFLAGVVVEYFVEFDLSRYVALAAFAVSYLILGGRVLLKMLNNIIRGRIFDENFLMGFATLGAIAINKPAEAVTVMLFYQIGEFFQDMAVAKSKKRIGDLMDIRPDYANVIIDGEYVKVDPESVGVQDTIIVKPGERIPLDGIVLKGESTLDMTALTGESLPKKVGEYDSVLSGSINQGGLLTIEVTQTYRESTVSKILDLVENAAHKKAPTETFITKFARYYTPAVVALAVLLAVIPPLAFGANWTDWIHRALVFLVISCPCALVISIPLGFFGGIGGASRKGILVKGGNYLEALANLDIVVFDKTGTLTEGIFQVVELQPADGVNEKDLLEVAARAESFSNHPIALSILKEHGKEIDRDNLSHYEEFPGYGVRVEASGHVIFAGNEKLMNQLEIAFKPVDSPGTKVYVAINQIYAGCIIIADKIKADSGEAISGIKSLGVRKTVMLTGDTWPIAKSVAEEVGLDEVYASLLPHDKVDKVEEISKETQPGKSLAFVGDGINDAPVLAMADVGVAMGALGTDAAIEAADVVLMTDEPAKLAEAVKTAKFTKQVVWQNIIMSLGVKFLFLLLATLGVSSLWEAIFADVGVSLIAVVNSMRVMNK